MNYSDNPGHVRIDRFKPTGKWYDTRVGDMSDLYGLSDDFNSPEWMTTHTAVALAIAQVFGDEHGEFIFQDGSYDWLFVVLEPYHKNSHPILLRASDVVRLVDEHPARLRKLERAASNG